MVAGCSNSISSMQQSVAVSNDVSHISGARSETILNSLKSFLLLSATPLNEQDNANDINELDDATCEFFESNVEMLTRSVLESIPNERDQLHEVTVLIDNESFRITELPHSQIRISHGDDYKNSLLLDDITFQQIKDVIKSDPDIMASIYPDRAGEQTKQTETERSENNIVSETEVKEEPVVMRPKKANTASIKPSSYLLINPTTRSIIEKSPSLFNDMNNLLNEGWRIDLGIPGGGTYVCKAPIKQVIIDSEAFNNPLRVIRKLAHEIGHATSALDARQQANTCDEFIRIMFMDEGIAVLNNIEVRNEILNNGGEDIGISCNQANVPKYLEVYDNLQQGKISREMAQQQIGDIYGNNETASCSNQPYLITYREMYYAEE